MYQAFIKGINIKSLTITMVVVFVYIWVSDFLIHGMLLKNTYMETANLWRSQEEMQSFMGWMLLGQFLYAKLFTMIFAKGYEGGGIGEGVRFGILMGFFSLAPICIQYATTPMPSSLLCSWAWTIMLQVIGAGVVASLVYKK